MKEESVYIDNMPENTSYERVYKKIVSNLIDRFTIGLSDYEPKEYGVCSIIEDRTLYASIIFLPEDVSFAEYIEQCKTYKREIYCILCHENTCFFVYQNEELSLQEAFDRIKHASSEIEKLAINVNNTLVKSLNELFSIQEIDFKKYINRNGLCYELTSDFYDTLFGKNNDVRIICRYSSLRSFFDILNNQSIRMCALPGMNDPSEGSFAYNYIHSVPVSNQRNMLYEEMRNRILYETLILSFCEGKEKFDELTQWRLYGDNAKGVCCEYELDGVLPNDYIFRRTIYENDNSKGTLVKLKKICDTVKQADRRFYVDTKLLYPFFKSDAYSIENEIRLMYKVNDVSELKWMLTQDHSIINAYKDFQLKDFPLKLKRVVLGPLMPNKETNKYQIKRMLECVASQVKELKYLRFVQVEISTIDCYR